MKDLFSPHPALANHWRHEGRSDHLVVFRNGTKLNPRSIEAAIKTALSGVAADVMVFGAGHLRPGLLVEPVAEISDSARVAFLDEVFAVTKVQSEGRTPGYGSFVRELLTVTTPGKPLPRSGNRTVQRGLALKLYAREIEELYAALPKDLENVRDYRIGAE